MGTDALENNNEIVDHRTLTNVNRWSILCYECCYFSAISLIEAFLQGLVVWVGVFCWIFLMLGFLSVCVCLFLS